MSDLYDLLARERERSRSSDAVRADLKILIDTHRLDQSESAACVSLFESMIDEKLEGPHRNVFLGPRETETKRVAQTLGSVASMHRVAYVLHTLAGRNKYVDGRYFMHGDLRELDMAWDGVLGWRS